MIPVTDLNLKPAAKLVIDRAPNSKQEPSVTLLDCARVRGLFNTSRFSAQEYCRSIKDSVIAWCDGPMYDSRKLRPLTRNLPVTRLKERKYLPLGIGKWMRLSLRSDLAKVVGLHPR